MVIKDKDRNITTITITEELYNYYQEIVIEHRNIENYLKDTIKTRDGFRDALYQILSYNCGYDNEDVKVLKEIVEQAFKEFDPDIY